MINLPLKACNKFNWPIVFGQTVCHILESPVLSCMLNAVNKYADWPVLPSDLSSGFVSNYPEKTPKTGFPWIDNGLIVHCSTNNRLASHS